jgi:hypothetical protein
LFSQLGSLLQKAGHYKTRVIALTPDQYARRALRQYKETGLLSEQARANAWKFTVAVEIAAVLTQELETMYHPTALPSLGRAQRFIRENYGGKVPDALTTATRLLKGLENFNLEAYGFKVGFRRETGDQPLTPHYDIEFVRKSIGV